MDFGVWLPLMEVTLSSLAVGTVSCSRLHLLHALDVRRAVTWWGCLCAATSHGGTARHSCSSVRFLLLFSDVLCPSVRVGGDRFRHTGGGTKEITGERTGLPEARSAALRAGPGRDPPGCRGGLAGPVPPRPW